MRFQTRLPLLSSCALCACLLTVAPTHPTTARAQASENVPAAQAAGVVNINTASAEELERLPSIGPSRARAILELRAKLSHFQRVEQLLRVKGIGRATFRKLRPLLAVQGPTTLVDKPAAR
jgi:competence protein ComEA